MTNKIFEVPNIHCMGCVQAISNELRELDGVASVNGDAGKQTIEVDFDAPATWEAIVAALTEIEYPPAAS